jgi:hypothetical protein
MKTEEYINTITLPEGWEWYDFGGGFTVAPTIPTRQHKPYMVALHKDNQLYVIVEFSEPEEIKAVLEKSFSGCMNGGIPVLYLT